MRSSERSCAFAVLSKLIGGTVQAVAAFSDCVVLELWLRAQTRSSSCLAAGVHFWDGVVNVCWWQAVAVFSDCVDILELWLWALVVLIDWEMSSSCEVVAAGVQVWVMVSSELVGGTQSGMLRH